MRLVISNNGSQLCRSIVLRQHHVAYVAGVMAKLSGNKLSAMAAAQQEQSSSGSNIVQLSIEDSAAAVSVIQPMSALRRRFGRSTILEREKIKEWWLVNAANGLYVGVAGGRRRAKPQAACNAAK